MYISIVIPVYNVSKELLDRCLDSVLSQITDDEIIIIDDGSCEDKVEEYQTICKQDERIHYYRQDNSGPSVARNNGVEKANGEYVLFLDADDYITDHCIDQAKRIILEEHPDIVFGYVYKDLSDDGSIRYKESDVTPQNVVVEGKQELGILLNHILGYTDSKYKFISGYLSDGPWCRFFKKDIFVDAKFDTVPRWNEDTLWNIELLNRCQKAVICKSLWYIYAIRKGSAMQGYRSNCYEEFMYITSKVYSVGHSSWKGEVDKGIAYRVWHDIFILSRGLIFNNKNADTFRNKYRMLKSAIKSDAYQKAISMTDFECEDRLGRKVMKQLLNGLMKTRLYLGAYIMIKTYVRKYS